MGCPEVPFYTGQRTTVLSCFPQCLWAAWSPGLSSGCPQADRCRVKRDRTAVLCPVYTGHLVCLLGGDTRSISDPKEGPSLVDPGLSGGRGPLLLGPSNLSPQAPASSG